MGMTSEKILRKINIIYRMGGLIGVVGLIRK